MLHHRLILMKGHDFEEDFLKVYDEFADAIFRHCLIRVWDRELARDITQEAFVKTWEYMAGGKEVKSLKAFLYRVSGNLIIDWSRKRKETSLDRLMQEGFDLASREHIALLAKTELREALELLTQLDEKHREVIVMRYIDQLSPKEIGEITGETENTVSVRIHRGLEHLRDLAHKKKG